MINRIKKVMEYAHLSSASFADTIEVNRSSLTHIFSGRNQPSLDVAKKILKAFPEVNTEWLVMGVGQMLKDNVESPEKTVPTTPATSVVDNMKQTDLFAEFEMETPEPEPQNDLKEVVPEPAASATTIEPIVESVPEPVEKSKPVVVSARNRGRNAESHISTRESKRERILDSQQDKKIVKIVFFYDDRSFEEYRPN